MKFITCFDDLAPHGVIPLTGEACGLSYRVLCDVTAKGKKLLEKALGLRDLGPAENWNRGTQADPHVGSVMLTTELITLIGVFALLDAGCKEVWTWTGRGVVGFEPTDDPRQIQSFHAVRAGELGRRFGYFGTAGDRNVHVFTGRVS